MKTLHINVANKVATYSRRDGDIVCGNSDYQVKFAFDSEWADVGPKTARFIWGGGSYDVGFTGDTCAVPKIRNAHEVQVGVYAGDLRTTTAAVIPCLRSILCGDEPQHPEREEDYASEAKEAAERASEDADRAEAAAVRAESTATADQVKLATAQATAAATSAARAESAAEAAKGAITGSAAYVEYLEQPLDTTFTVPNGNAHAPENDRIFVNLKAGERLYLKSNCDRMGAYVYNGETRTELGKVYADEWCVWAMPHDIDSVGFYRGNTTGADLVVKCHAETDKTISAKNLANRLGYPNKESVEMNAWTAGGYIKVPTLENEVTGNVIAISTYKCQMIEVNAGDAFYLQGVGGDAARLYGFADKDRILQYKPGKSVTFPDPTLIVAPYDGYLIVNVNTESPNSLTRVVEKSAFDRINTMEGLLEGNTTTINLKGYGAVGDGVTDDTEAINEALRAAQNGTLYVPEGTYLFSSTLHIGTGTKIEGTGKNSVFKMVSTGFSFSSISWRPDAVANSRYRYPVMLFAEDAEGCVLKDFCLDGEVAAFVDHNQDGITIRGKNHRVEGVIVHDINYFPDSWSGRGCNTPGYGIHCFNVENVNVVGVDIWNCGYENFGTEYAENITVTGSKFGLANQTGFQVHRSSHHIRLENSTIKTKDNVNAPEGFTMDADPAYPMSDIHLVGCYVDTHVNTVAGGETYIFIEGNKIDGMFHIMGQYADVLVIRGNYIGWRINAYAKNVIIADNVFNNPDTPQYYMIQVRGKNIHVDNNFSTCGHEEINIVEVEDI